MKCTMLPQIDARTACQHVLKNIDDGCPLQESIALVCSHFFLTQQEKNLLHELSYGILRTESRMLFIVEQYQKKKIFPSPSSTFSLSLSIHCSFFNAYHNTPLFHVA